MHGHGYTLAGIFFGLWLLPLGFLALRSGLFPRMLSILLLVAGGSWILPYRGASRRVTVTLHNL